MLREGSREGGSGERGSFCICVFSHPGFIAGNNVVNQFTEPVYRQLFQ